MRRFDKKRTDKCTAYNEQFHASGGVCPQKRWLSEVETIARPNLCGCLCLPPTYMKPSGR